MRSIWKGMIGFGLVNIPIKLYSAVQSSSLDFDLLDSRDHARIRYQRVNEKTRQEVPYDKVVKGFSLDGDYVIVEDKDFEDASPHKTKVIEIESFVEMEEISPIFYETSYYAEPETQGRKAYLLLLRALQKSKKAGLARFVLRNTEHLCVLHPLSQAIAVTKIRFAQEIKSTDELSIPNEVEVSKKELDVGLALINQYTAKFDISKFKNEYREDLLKIIKAKAKGKRPTIKKIKPIQHAEDDLYQQLMQSLNKKGA